MARRQYFTAEFVKQHVGQRWPEILGSLGGLPQSIVATARDKKEHPCPKCGGSTRCRIIDAEAGAVFCNQCFRKKSGDGFAALMWLKGWTLTKAINQVANYLGLQADPLTAQPKKGNQKQSPHTEKKRPKQNHTNGKVLRWDLLQSTPWVTAFEKLFCLKKIGVGPEGLRECHCIQGEYCGQRIIAIPFWNTLPSENGIRPESPSGFSMYRFMGFFYREINNDKGKPKEFEAHKTLQLIGSRQGYMGTAHRIRDAKIIWLLEGGPDLLTLVSHVDFPRDHAALSSSCGSGSMAKLAQNMPELFANKRVIVVPDVDENESGQRGAADFCDALNKQNVAAKIHVEHLTTLAELKRAGLSKLDLRDWGGSKTCDSKNLADLIQRIAAEQ